MIATCRAEGVLEAQELPLLFAAMHDRDAHDLALAKQFEKHPSVEVLVLIGEAERAVK